MSENRNDRLCSLSVIVSEHSAEPFTGFDLADHATDFRADIDDLPIQSLMIPLPMVMLKILSRCSIQRFLTE
jgi:hypothetical protein